MVNQLPRLLRMVHGEPEPDEPTGQYDPESGPRTAPEAQGTAPVRTLHIALAAPPAGHAHHMLMWAQDYLAALRRQVKAQRDAEGGIGAWLDNGHAPTNAEQREYAQKRAWVHPGDEGGWVEQTGVAYYATLGKAVPALCNATGWIFARQLRAAIAGALVYLLALAAVFAFEGTAAGFLMIVALAALLGAGRGLAELAAALRRRASAPHEPSSGEAADGSTEEPQWD